MVLTPIVYLGLPSRGSTVCLGAAHGFLAAPTAGKCGVIRAGAQSSLLCYGFNSLWAGALNHRKEGVTHFAMIHDDIAPQQFWLDILLDEMARFDADVISAVVPIKSTQGLTSTGVDDPDNPWHPRRLTMAEVMQLPETFGVVDLLNPMPKADKIPALLINSGLMLARLDHPWCERVVFHIKDRIIQGPDGYEAQVASEDWNFSRDLADWGCRVYATRKVRVEHVGEYAYPNDFAWGHWETDKNWGK